MNSVFRNFSAMLALATLAIANVTIAAEDEHAAHHPAPAATPPAGASADAMTGMKKMQEQMAAISATKDPKERARLLDEHMKTMQSTMQQMQAGNGCTMMGNGAAMMEGRGGGMNMMQMMMDQMMQHQKAMQGTSN